MNEIKRLVTTADSDAREDEDTISVSARHELELADGTRVILLDDRGWGGGPWAMTSLSEVEQTARNVVGPDDEECAAQHWDYLTQIAEERGVHVDAKTLQQLPHDVVLTACLRARLAAVPVE